MGRIYFLSDNLSFSFVLDALFKSTFTPISARAAKTLARIRQKELATTWTPSYDDSISSTASKTGGHFFPGMMFTLARDRMEKESNVWRIIERMPKGALLHAHMDAMFDIDWLVDQVLGEEGLCILAPDALADDASRQNGRLEIRYVEPRAASTDRSRGGNIWTIDYESMTPVSITVAANSFPAGGAKGFREWLISRCVIDEDESYYHHQGLDAIWQKFQRCFLTIGWLLFYEPIFRRGMQRMLGQLADDGISYVDFRIAFKFEFRLKGMEKGEPGKFMEFFRVFDEEIESFKKTEKGSTFHGARMIWTIIRASNNREIVPNMRECIRVKKAMPHIIAGFDYVGQEDKGRTLAELVPITFWFRKQCVEAGVEIPFFFHAGECLGDGDSTDKNLYDAILLGTRRIGHGYSLYKHPLLIDMVKEKKILVESCPISNEILRLSSSILSHSLPALLSRGVSVSLNNDDPAILGHGKNGLSHDFWQAFMAFENLGLEGLATMAENSVRWSAIEDQKQGEWLQEISDGYMGQGVKAQRLKGWRSEFEKFCQWIIMEFPLDDEDEDEST
jgi:adenosine deaminase CECR1